MKSRRIWFALLGLTFLFSAFGLQAQAPGEWCGSAIPINCGDVVNGSTTGSSPGYNGSPDAWYALPSLSGLVTASTCNGATFDTYIRIVRQSPGGTPCSSFNVVAQNDNACGIWSEATFAANPAYTYYVVVHGTNASQFGDFRLSITCGGTNPPANDDCANASPIACGGFATGNTTYATPDPGFNSRGVWYTVQGTGGNITASLCGSSFDTQIWVFDGSCSGPLVVSGDDECNFQSEVTWASTLGTTYYVLVNGYSASSYGNYQLAVSCAPTTVGNNDYCHNAVPLQCGSLVAGTTLGATPDGIYSAPGVWFSFQGNDQLVTASLCNGTNFDSQLHVYYMPNGAASCYNSYYGVTHNDDFCGLNAEVTWFAQAGRTYFILLNGADAGDAGDYTLSITCDDDGKPDNEDCEKAVDLECGESYTGTNQGSGTINPSNNPGVWVHVVGDGSVMTASLCGGATWDTYIYLYSGSCQNLVYIDENDDFCGLQSQISWQSVVGVDYYILIGGYNGSTGQFTISIKGDCQEKMLDGGSGETRKVSLPSPLALDVAVAPNPSTDFVEFSIELPKAGLLEIEVFDLAGKPVAKVFSGLVEAGSQQIRHDWNGLAAGMYIYKVKCGNGSSTGKLQLLH